jgi:hypothetical protein
MTKVHDKKEGLSMEELKAQSGHMLPKRLEIRHRGGGRRGFFGGICIGFCGGGGFPFGGGG